MDRDAQKPSQSPGATQAPGAGDSAGRHPLPDDPPQSVGDAFCNAGAALRELREYISFYVSTQIDSVRHVVRRIGILAGLSAIALVAAGAMVVVAIVLIFNGIAGGFFQLFNQQYQWVADLITGVVMLGVLFIAIYIVMARNHQVFSTTNDGEI